MAATFRVTTCILLTLLLAACSSAPEAQNRSSASEVSSRALVLDFYDRFFNRHDVSAAAVVAEDYKQHNPDLPDGRAALVRYFTEYFASNPQSRVRIIRSAVEGDLVYLHVHSKNDAEDIGQAVIDIFRVKDGMIVEHWDVIQNVPEYAANTNTMF